MIAYYMDENMLWVITNGVRDRGIDVLTVQEDGLSGLDDQEIFKRSITLERVLVSFDQDLITEAQQYQAIRAHFKGLIFIQLHKASLGKFITEFELISLTSQTTEYRNQIQ